LGSAIIIASGRCRKLERGEVMRGDERGRKEGREREREREREEETLQALHCMQDGRI